MVFHCVSITKWSTHNRHNIRQNCYIITFFYIQEGILLDTYRHTFKILYVKKNNYVSIQKKFCKECSNFVSPTCNHTALLFNNNIKL